MSKFKLESELEVLQALQMTLSGYENISCCVSMYSTPDPFLDVSVSQWIGVDITLRKSYKIGEFDKLSAAEVVKEIKKEFCIE